MTVPVAVVYAVCALALLVVAAVSVGRSASVGPSDDAPGTVPVRPAALATARDGSVYIAEPTTHQVRVVRSDGTVLPFAGISGKAGVGSDGVRSQDAPLDAPSGVAVGIDGTVYIADTGNHRVRRVKDGIVETVPGTTGISQPVALTVGPADDLYVTDKAMHRVLLVRKDGTVESVAGNGTGGLASLNSPHGIAAGSSGLYIADTKNQVVRWSTLTGGNSLMTLAGTGSDTGPSTDGGPATAAALSLPIAVAASHDDAFILENGSRRIGKVGANGSISTIDTGKVKLSSPTGIAVDVEGVIYVADSNRLIRIADGKADVVATHGAR